MRLPNTFAEIFISTAHIEARKQTGCLTEDHFSLVQIQVFLAGFNVDGVTYLSMANSKD